MRTDVIKQICDNLREIDSTHAIIVGIDGKDASGKTTFANECAEQLAKLTSREVVRISLDDFFNPRAIRYQQGQSARGCYEDTFDISGIHKHLLESIHRDNTYATKIFDYKTDTPVDIVEKHASPDAIIVIDGVFLQRPEFRKYWDYTILLDVDDEVTIERGTARDIERIGDAETARQKYINRYIASQKIYYDECTPRNYTSVTVDNTDFAHPIFVSLNKTCAIIKP